MKKRIYLITLCTITFFLISFLVIYQLIAGVSVNIEKGKLDFSSYSIDKYYSLDGEWEVYHNVLLGTNNLNPDDYPRQYVKLPTKRKSSQETLSYRIVITNFPQNIPTTIVLENLNESYSIYLNRKLILSNNNDNTQSLYYILESDEPLEIIIETTNNSYGHTSTLNSPHIVSYNIYQANNNITLAYYFVILGILIFVIIYIIYIISFQNFRRESIYFAFFIFFGIINIFFTKRLSLYFNFSPILSYYAYYLSLFLGPVFLYFFIRKFLNKKGFGALDIFFFILTIIILLLTSALPLNIQANYHIFIRILNIITLLLLLLYVLTYAQKETYQHFISFIIALLILGNTISLLNDENVFHITANITSLVYLSVSLIYTAIVTISHADKIDTANEVVKLNEKIRETEFTFLNSQIQSHFIYNSLNSIQSLCLIDPLKAADLIEDFSSYLRSRLEFNKMPILIEFADELNNIKTYLNIEKERFGERIKYEYDIHVGEFKIPPLSVQPLVENAIKHGLSKKVEGGTLKISTSRDENYIYIIIEDDGLGFDPEKLSEKQRVGTTNIKDRLALHLNATLEIKSKVGVGTTSMIKIPVDKALN